MKGCEIRRVPASEFAAPLVIPEASSVLRWEPVSLAMNVPQSPLVLLERVRVACRRPFLELLPYKASTKTPVGTKDLQPNSESGPKIV